MHVWLPRGDSNEADIATMLPKNASLTLFPIDDADSLHPVPQVTGKLLHYNRCTSDNNFGALFRVPLVCTHNLYSCHTFMVFRRDGNPDIHLEADYPRRSAESHPGTTARNTVATIPAYFNGSQHPAIKDGGATSMKRPSSDQILRRDRQGILEVAGDNSLGWEAFEYRLVNDSTQEITRKSLPNPCPLRPLHTACERAKRTLSYAAVSCDAQTPSKPTASSRPRAVKFASDVFNRTETYKGINPVKAVAYASAVRVALSFETPQRRHRIPSPSTPLPSPSVLKPLDRPREAQHHRPQQVVRALLHYSDNQSGIRSILNVSVSVSETNYPRGESNKAKGHLSKEADDNPVEPYAYNLCNSHDDEELADKLAIAGNLKLDGSVNYTSKWLNVS
ncbi:hypothetical protein B0H19DRAFT_1066685 [Mycena capillaripes]|nr:hypothetical protein B0H19DRAFT_1066685 [Mycena capillaripes]